VEQWIVVTSNSSKHAILLNGLHGRVQLGGFSLLPVHCLLVLCYHVRSLK